jgi:hypothetical protein
MFTCLAVNFVDHLWGPDWRGEIRSFCPRSNRFQSEKSSADLGGRVTKFGEFCPLSPLVLNFVGLNSNSAAVREIEGWFPDGRYRSESDAIVLRVQLRLFRPFGAFGD